MTRYQFGVLQIWAMQSKKKNRAALSRFLLKEASSKLPQGHSLLGAAGAY
jgi:hypothetical protein